MARGAFAIFLLALMIVTPASADEVLSIGRQSEATVSSAVSQRVMTEAITRAGLTVVFRRLPLPRS
jgi:hypothetical protein